MPDQLDAEVAVAVNALRRRMNDFQREIGNPVTQLPTRLADGRDVWMCPTCHRERDQSGRCIACGRFLTIPEENA